MIQWMPLLWQGEVVVLHAAVIHGHPQNASPLFTAVSVNCSPVQIPSARRSNPPEPFSAYITCTHLYCYPVLVST